MTADWIRDFRRSMGLSREGFARAVTYQLGGRGGDALTVTGALIGILEDRNEAVTHPRLADLIAAACGATRKQRDSIVHKKHRGTWPGVDGPRLLRDTRPRTRYPTVPSTSNNRDRYAHNNKAVVVLDRMGNEVKRFDSGKAAAAFVGVSSATVYSRCAHAAPMEFTNGSPYTARYIAEWDKLSPSAKAFSIQRALRLSGKDARTDYSNGKKAVVVLDSRGRERTRYASIAEAATCECTSESRVSQRCNRMVKKEFAYGNDTTYRFAEEWDTMNDEQRRKDVGAV